MRSNQRRRFPGEGRLLTGMAVDAVGNGMYVPFTIVFFRHVTDLPLPVIGLVLTITGLAGMAALPVVGSLVDHYGARRVQLALYLVRGLAFLAYPFSGSLAAFFLVSLVAAGATRGFPAAQQARIGELVSGADLERLNALGRSLVNGGLGAGSLLAALLVGYAGGTGYTVAALVNAASFFVAGVLAWGVPENGAPRAVPNKGGAPQIGYRAVLADRPVLGLSAANLLISHGYAALSVLLPVYLTEVLREPQSLTGVAFAVNTVLCAGLGVPAGRLVARFGSRNRAAATGAGLFAVAFVADAALGLAAPGSGLVTAGVLGAVVLATLGEVVHNPAASALVTAAAPPALRGRYMATYQLSWSLSAAIAPSLFTGLMALDGRLPWLVLAAAVAAGALLLLTLEKHLPEDAVRVQPSGARGSADQLRARGREKQAVH
ncbi:MFS transporter [Kitasatospora sp. MMS16-BH015]|uniref:MFS transporter n=1 Tax=Kitasatospora sp. MMS16-BH015 TaxID=2018025 RepID=UPI000CA0AF51|nr:MFS transporter [Kitasatospora sp. MMS16-BH015]AUG77171.1 MFS transporter [Kitasatospora sp. MMS16-BH015]